MKNIAKAIPAKTTTEKAPNYTEAQVQVLRDNAPLDLVKAKQLAGEMNKNYRSIIAKAKREGIEYISIAPAEPKKKGPTKREMVASIEKQLNMKLTGLDKAPVLVISNLLTFANENQQTA